jgi:hypothetical protein
MLIAANLAIVLALRSSSKMRVKMRGEVSKTKQVNTGKTYQITMMLLGASTYFIASSLFRQFHSIFWAIAPQPVRRNFGFISLSVELALWTDFSSYATGFYIYILTCCKFKEEFKQILFCGSKASTRQMSK